MGKETLIPRTTTQMQASQLKVKKSPESLGHTEASPPVMIDVKRNALDNTNAVTATAVSPAKEKTVGFDMRSNIILRRFGCALIVTLSTRPSISDLGSVKITSSNISKAIILSGQI